MLSIKSSKYLKTALIIFIERGEYKTFVVFNAIVNVPAALQFHSTLTHFSYMIFSGLMRDSGLFSLESSEAIMF